MKWCCVPFEGWSQKAGKRGIAVFVGEAVDGELDFVLQARTVDVGVEMARMNSSDNNALLSLVSEMVIQYCPWCGRHLMRWYKKDLVSLVKPGLRIPL